MGQAWRSMSETDDLVRRLPAIDYAHPVIDRDRAVSGLIGHMKLLGLEPIRVRWMPDAEEGFLRAERGPGSSEWKRRLNAVEVDTDTGAGGSPRYLTRAELWPVAWRPFEDRARRSAAGSVERRTLREHLTTGWTAAGGAVRALSYLAALGSAKGRLEKIACEGGLRLWSPLFEAYAAGLWLYWILHQEVVAVARPALRTVDETLHCPDGPAVAWPGGAQYYFWRGMEVPKRLIMEPEELRARAIVGEPNRELQRVMLERFGYDRFILELAAVPVQADGFGTLYRIHMGRYRQSLALVHVTNSTPEPDGTRKRYFLRVPPNVRTAREAVAWTFGMRAAQYRPGRET